MLRRTLLLTAAAVTLSPKVAAQSQGTETSQPAPSAKSIIPVLVAPPKYDGPKRQDIKSVKALTTPDGKGVPVVAEALVGPLQIWFGEPRSEGIRFLQESEVAALGVARDQLRAVGLKNWSSAYPAQPPRDLGGGLWLVERTFASTLMLVPTFWEEWKGKVSGALTLVAPARDVVAFTGGGSRSNMRALGSIIQQAKRMSYDSQLTPSMFRWEQGAWELWQ